jgi:hypothetical protein
VIRWHGDYYSRNGSSVLRPSVQFRDPAPQLQLKRAPSSLRPGTRRSAAAQGHRFRLSRRSSNQTCRTSNVDARQPAAGQGALDQPNQPVGRQPADLLGKDDVPGASAGRCGVARDRRPFHQQPDLCRMVLRRLLCTTSTKRTRPDARVATHEFAPGPRQLIDKLGTIQTQQ